MKKCRELGISDGGFYQPVFSSGKKMNLKMMCLGKNWDPESNLYSDTRASDNAKPPEIPELFHDMVIKALQDANDYIRDNVVNAERGKIIPSMKPDLCIINFYSNSGRLGLHQVSFLFFFCHFKCLEYLKLESKIVKILICSGQR